METKTFFITQAVVFAIPSIGILFAGLGTQGYLFIGAWAILSFKLIQGISKMMWETKEEMNNR